MALRGGARVAARAGALLPVLRRGAAAPSAGLPDAGDRVSPEVKRWGEEGAFFFAPHSLSPGEGSAGRKRMPRSRAEEKRRGKAEFSRTVAKEGTLLVLTMGATLRSSGDRFSNAAASVSRLLL